MNGNADTTPVAAGSLLVVLEPPGGVGGPGRPVGVGGSGGLGGVDGPGGAGGVGGVGRPGGAALLAEGARLARQLGVGLHVVTWRARPELDLESVAAALAGLAGQRLPVALVLADTDIGRQLAPMVAQRLGSGAVVGCSDVLVGGASQEAGGGGETAGGPSTMTFVKPVYGGWLEREISSDSGVVPVVTLELAGTEEPESRPDEVPAAEVLDIGVAAPARVRRLELVPPDARTVDLVHAARIVAAGSGSASEGLLAAVRELADLLEGSVGATRPVVDDGRLPKERLIGQTGKTVTPELYLALGISGSPHHVAGVRRADRILSINRDIRAPIFQFSDVGYVADLEVVLPALVKKIKDWRDAPREQQ